jgi:hypothetical protein
VQWVVVAETKTEKVQEICRLANAHSERSAFQWKTMASPPNNIAI